MIKCLKCGDTGITVDGKQCDCKEHGDLNLPVVLEVPVQYQNVKFSSSLVPMNLPKEYGVELEKIVEHINTKGKYSNNLLICSPPLSGKTVFAYSIYKCQYMHSIPMSEIIDLLEAKELLYNNSYDLEFIEKKELFINCPVAVVKIPMLLPNRFAETISSIIERRIRKNGITIFLSNLKVDELYFQDKQEILKSIVRDGSYGSIKVMNYYPVKRKELHENDN